MGYYRHGWTSHNALWLTYNSTTTQTAGLRGGWRIGKANEGRREGQESLANTSQTEKRNENTCLRSDTHLKR